MSTDSELLRSFIDTRSEPAFEALVQRHLRLVYSAALRQQADSSRAQDVTQAVFTLLVRKAPSLRNHPSIAGWLYTATHFEAARARRAEQRRLQREGQALAMQDDLKQTPTNSELDELSPVIDSALMELKEVDRTAVVLRYFEDQSYGEIGAQLGVSENTVRMRVNRSLDRLRASLSRRGIESTAAAIGVTLAAQTTEAMPTGLLASVSAAALAAPAGNALIFLMNASFLKTSIVTALIIGGAAGLILQHRQIASLEASNAKLMAALRVTAGSSNNAAPSAAGPNLARLKSQLESLKRSHANSWQERVELLKDALAKLPEQNIPEISLASEEDWLDATKGKLDSADDYRQAFAKLRNLAIGKFIKVLQPALAEYVAANGGKFPENVSELKSFVSQPINNAIWNRYVVTSADTVANVRMGGQTIITQISVVDPANDWEFVVGPNGSGSTTFGVSSINAVRNAYRLANGKSTDNYSELLPYAATPRQRAVVTAFIERGQTDEAVK